MRGPRAAPAPPFPPHPPATKTPPAAGGVPRGRPLPVLHGSTALPTPVSPRGGPSTPARQPLQLPAGCWRPPTHTKPPLPGRGSPSPRRDRPRRAQPPSAPAAANGEGAGAEACPLTLPLSPPPLPPGNLFPGPRRAPGPARPTAAEPSRAGPTHPLRRRPRSLCSPPGRGGGEEEGACAFRLRTFDTPPPASSRLPAAGLVFKGKAVWLPCSARSPHRAEAFPAARQWTAEAGRGCGESVGRRGQRRSGRCVRGRGPAITGKEAPPRPARGWCYRCSRGTVLAGQSPAPGLSPSPRDNKGKVRAGNYPPSRSCQHFPQRG